MSKNVLFLMADQHRQDITGCYGHPIVQTPHIDRLASQGVRFDNAFCPSPLCGPSRASAITGTYPHTNGNITHPNARHRSGKRYAPQLTPGVTSLVADFRDQGYQTHAAGYIGVLCDMGEQKITARDLGFDSQGAYPYESMVGKEISRRYHFANALAEMWEPSYFNVEGAPFPYDEADMCDSIVAADAIDFLAHRDTDRPFYLYCGFRAPHPPWCAPARFHAMYSPDNIGALPDYTVEHRNKPRRLMERFAYFDIKYYSEEMVRRSIAAYYGFVTYMDDCVGRVLAALDAQGLRDDTLIVYTADHGENLYRHGLCEKHCFFEGSIKIPLIFSLPGMLPEGVTTEAMASSIDILPTVQALCGLETPAFVEGCDLRPTFTGETVREHVFAEYYHSLDPCRMVRDTRYKYIHTEEDICELYDLQRDPMERDNLAWYPEYAERVQAMDALVLRDWEIPEVPIHATWNDLNERKQKQRLRGLPIIDVRPPLQNTAHEPSSVE